MVTLKFEVAALVKHRHHEMIHIDPNQTSRPRSILCFSFEGDAEHERNAGGHWEVRNGDFGWSFRSAYYDLGILQLRGPKLLNMVLGPSVEYNTLGAGHERPDARKHERRDAEHVPWVRVHLCEHSSWWAPNSLKRGKHNMNIYILYIYIYEYIYIYMNRIE